MSEQQNEKRVLDQAVVKQLTEEHAGQRLDVVLVKLFPEYSRSRLKLWIEQGQVLLNGKTVKPKTKIAGDEELQLWVQTIASEERCIAEDIPIDIVHQDEAIIVINKPAGLVVHQAAGHYSGTLQNALLYFDASLEAVPRAGIVHRLDKDTTGLMVVARTLSAHKYLVDQIQKHEIIRQYQALVYGVMTGGGMVDQPIGRHPRDRIKMAVRENGRQAVTHYRLLQRFREHCHIKVQLETGRTHQIRVHMSHLRHPIVGDPVYSGRHRNPAGAQAELLEYLQKFKRQALHAWRLSFVHPLHDEQVTYEAPLPDDMQQLITLLQADLQTNG
ncbi:MAG: 23S rRNA pseudouridine(1911/1915/1917) synthase RluD [Gammaproteobacteria bacterium]|nr:MAG: 23S rRNA pseudouridine(1911/1915/1917) synthase RluD [Gammaproteobacteria bacterium]